LTSDEGAPRTDGGPRGGRIFGLALSELDASLREEYQIEPHVHGLVVRAVDAPADGGPALQPGDVIEELAFQPVDSINAARAIASRAQIANHAIVAKVNRDGAVTYRRLTQKSS
jgi:serine protease Do